jgi:MtN3 and saliva related transmembrane protein
MHDLGLFFLEAGAGMMTSKMIVDLIGYVAACMTTVSFLPQLIRVVKLRSARDISLGMFLIFTAGTLCWLIYGLLVHSLPVSIANGVTLVLSASILFLKLRFDRRAVSPVQPRGAPR